ncbi:MAG: HD domain-containing protein [Verrucomicrobia bacterium]|nr:HD domain-containing protein [Verrucomicrobiota bacterium]
MDLNTLSTIEEIKKMDHAQGTDVKGVFVLKKKAVKKAKNDSSYFSLEYGDRTGNFHSFCFGDNPIYSRLESIDEGSPVFVQLITGVYQGRFSPRLTETRSLSDEELADPDLSARLVETCLENPEELWAEFQKFVEAIEHEGLRTTVRLAIGEIEVGFRSTPAAVAMHHAYRHGLLEHTIHMARACQALLPFYTEVDPGLAMAGLLLHDIGKVIEYEGELSVSKSRIGILQGHVVLGYRMARKAGMVAKLEPDLLERLEHIILSHQGEMEWGATAMAATPEAVFVSMIDNLDARMGMVQYALRHRSEDKPFSDFLPGLKAPLLTDPISKIELSSEDIQDSLDL